MTYEHYPEKFTSKKNQPNNYLINVIHILNPLQLICKISVLNGEELYITDSRNIQCIDSEKRINKNKFEEEIQMYKQQVNTRA